MNCYRRKRNGRRTKLVSPEKLPFAVKINLYGKNKIGVMSFWDKIGRIIKSEGIFKTPKSIFELNWQSLPERNVKHDAILDKESQKDFDDV